MWGLTIAGGRGERLRPLTDDTCKPMVMIDGAPLLAYQAAWLRRNGCEDIVFLTGYMPDMVEDYFGDGSRFGFRAHYSVEDHPLGRGGALKQGLGLVPSSESDIAVVNGDVLTNQPLQPLVDIRREKSAAGTLMLTPYISPFGIVEVESDGAISAFTEKGELPYWVNAGVYIFDRGIEGLLPEIGDHETETFPRLASRRELQSYQSRAPWVSVDSFKDMGQAEEMIRAGQILRP